MVLAHLELLLCRARPNSPTCLKDCKSSLYSGTNKQIKMLLPYVNSIATGWHSTGNPTASHSMKQSGQTLQRGCWVVRSCFPVQQLQLSIASTIQEIWEILVHYWGKPCPNAQNICKTLYMPIFDTYQKVDYLLRLWIVHLTESMCSSIVVM